MLRTQLWCQTESGIKNDAVVSAKFSQSFHQKLIQRDTELKLKIASALFSDVDWHQSSKSHSERVPQIFYIIRDVHGRSR